MAMTMDSFTDGEPSTTTCVKVGDRGCVRQASATRRTMGLQLRRKRQPQISRNPKHINEYGYECIISFMYCSEEE